MSERLPNREQAIRILIDNHCPPQVVNHCIAVANYALQIGAKLQAKGLPIDIMLVEAGGLLHDIGRSQTHAVDHSLVGSQIAQEIGLPQSIVNVIKRHVGAGITSEEAKWLGWPNDNYVPQTLEEKIVSYADKRIDHDEVVPIENEIQKLQNRGYPQAAERVRNLHKEISELLGETI